jgi:hypothetical protein
MLNQLLKQLQLQPNAPVARIITSFLSFPVLLFLDFTGGAQLPDLLAREH